MANWAACVMNSRRNVAEASWVNVAAFQSSGVCQRRVSCAPRVNSGYSLCCRVSDSKQIFRPRANTNNQHSQSQKSALDDPDVAASRDSLEDTPGAGATEMLHAFAGKNDEVNDESGNRDSKSVSRDCLEGTTGSDAVAVLEDATQSDSTTAVFESFIGDSTTEKHSQEQGKVGVEAFDQREPKNIEGIEQQYLLNDDKLEDGSENNEKTNTDIGKSISSKGESAGRDWRVFADGLSSTATELGSEEESKSSCSKRKDLAERLWSLEDFVMKKDNGKSAEDYSRRADIFEKSGQVFKARKEGISF